MNIFTIYVNDYGDFLKNHTEHGKLEEATKIAKNSLVSQKLENIDIYEVRLVRRNNADFYPFGVQHTNPAKADAEAAMKIQSALTAAYERGKADVVPSSDAPVKDLYYEGIKDGRKQEHEHYNAVVKKFFDTFKFGKDINTDLAEKHNKLDDILSYAIDKCWRLQKEVQAARAEGERAGFERAAKIAQNVENRLGNPTHGYHCGFMSGRTEASCAIIAAAPSPASKPEEKL